MTDTLISPPVSALPATPEDSQGADAQLDLEDIDWDEAPLKACPRCNHAHPVRQGYSRRDSAEMVRIACPGCGLAGKENFWCSMETAVTEWNALPRLAEMAAQLEDSAIGAGEANRLRDHVLAAQKAISQAHNTYHQAEREAADRRRREQAAPNRLLDTLKDKFRERAEELAQAAGECPRSHWGQFLDPDEVRVDADGLALSWDINGDYAPATFLASWEALTLPAGEDAS